MFEQEVTKTVNRLNDIRHFASIRQDRESDHIDADNILLEFITKVTKNDKIKKAFESIDKYYI